MTTKWYGVAHSSGIQAFKAFDPSRFMVYYAADDDPEARTPEDLNHLADQMRRAFRDTRRIAAIVRGNASHARAFRAGLDEDLFSVAVIVGPLNLLKQLDVEILDADWQEGDEQISMDQLTASVREGVRVRTLHGARGVVTARRGAFAHVLLEGAPGAVAVSLWAVRPEEE